MPETPTHQGAPVPTEPTTRRRVAFIFPIYNEEANIDLLHRTVDEVTAPLAGRYDFSFIYVDDGSRDASLDRLTELGARDPRVTVVELSRNFGHQMAVTAGLDLVDADAAIIMDSDLQDPPRVALELLEHAGKGRQRVAVLGTMLELGPQADRLHDEVARSALELPIDLVVGVGGFADALARVAPGDARVVAGADPESAWRALHSRLEPDAIILLKGSRGVRLERLVPLISEWASAPR